MKKPTALALIALATTLPPVSAAQSFNGPPVFNWRLLNAVANSGFESVSTLPWTSAGSYRVDYGPTKVTTTYGPSSGYRRAGGYSGSACYDFGIAMDNTAPFDVFSVLHQDLPTPVSGGAIWSASARVYGVGPFLGATSQTVFLTIKYTDGTTSSAFANTNLKPANGTGEWQLWDFKSAIDTTRTIKSLDFSVLGAWNHPNGIRIDDIALTRWVYVG